jgi:hypothetical protein
MQERMSQLRKMSGSKNFKILYDNAKPHVTKTVTEHLKKGGITIIRPAIHRTRRT